MIKRIGSLLLFVVVLVGCNKKEAYTEIAYANKFSLEVPTAMQKTKALNSQATLQLQNTVEELYLIAIDENKEAINQMFDASEIAKEGVDSFALFSQATLDLLTTTLDTIEPNELQLQEVRINNLNGKVVDFTASVAGLEVYYKFATFEGKEDYYQVLTWTLKQNKEKNKEQMNKMIESFKEVKK